MVYSHLDTEKHHEKLEVLSTWQIKQTYSPGINLEIFSEVFINEL